MKTKAFHKHIGQSFPTWCPLAVLYYNFLSAPASMVVLNGTDGNCSPNIGNTSC